MFTRRACVLPPFYLVLLVLLPQIHGRQTNVTIDDQYGDPTTGQAIQYNPPEAWQPGQGCEPCTAKPSPAGNAHNGTWMDATYFPTGTGTNGVSGQIISASVPFIGTAVYVNVILTGSITSPDGNSDFTFYIDNVTAGVFQRAPDGDRSYKFNQIVFAKTGLSNNLHTVMIEAGRANNKTLVLLDSIIYTKETTDTDANTSTNSTQPPTATESSSRNSNIGIIVGPVVGGIIVAGALLGLVFFLRRRRQGQGQRVRVLIDSPPMESLSPGNAAASYIDPFISSGPHAPYSQSNQSGAYVASTSGVLLGAGSGSDLYSGPALASSSEVNVASQHIGLQARGDTSRYGEVEESGVDVTTPLASPPAYSEVDSSVSSNVSRLPNPYGKGGRSH